MYSMYFFIASSISERMMNSSAWCDRDESPGPILIASECIRIQFDVVGDEKVAMFCASAAFISGELMLVADERLVRFRGVRRLLQSD